MRTGIMRAAQDRDVKAMFDVGRIFSWRTVKLFALCFVLLGCNEQIVHNLNEQDANRLITKLSDANIEASKVKQPDGLWALAVPSGNSIEALKFLDGARVFKGAPSVPDDGASLMSSREDQLFRFERALSREVEATLTSIDGVLQARVHLNLPPTDPLFGQPLVKDQKGSASVLLITDEKFKLTKENISALVAGASGLENAKVAVLVGGSSEAAIEALPVHVKEQEISVGLSSLPLMAVGWLRLNQNLVLQIGFGLCGCGLLALAWLYFSRRRLEY